MVLDCTFVISSWIVPAFFLSFFKPHVQQSSVGVFYLHLEFICFGRLMDERVHGPDLCGSMYIWF